MTLLIMRRLPRRFAAHETVKIMAVQNAHKLIELSASGPKMICASFAQANLSRTATDSLPTSPPPPVRGHNIINLYRRLRIDIQYPSGRKIGGQSRVVTRNHWVLSQIPFLDTGISGGEY